MAEFNPLDTTQKPRKPGGRPTLLTPALYAAIIEAAGPGAGPAAIAEALGISVGTLGEWLRRGRGVAGRPAVEPHRSFARDFEAARRSVEDRQAEFLRWYVPELRVRWTQRWGQRSPWVNPPAGGAGDDRA